MDASDNNVSSGYDNASAVSPDAILHKALGAVPPPPPPAAQAPQQSAPTAQPQAQQPATQAPQDPWAAFPDAKPQSAQAKTPANDPWSAFPDAPKSQEQGGFLDDVNNNAEAGKSTFKEGLNEQNDPDALNKIEGMGKMASGAFDVASAPVKSAVKSIIAEPIAKLLNLPQGSDQLSEQITQLITPMLPELFGAIQKGGTNVGEAINNMRNQPIEGRPSVDAQTQGMLATPAELSKDLLPKSAGQITQDPAMQREEADMMAGIKGPQSQSEALAFRAKQSQAMEQQLGNFGTPEQGANKADTVGNIASILQKEYETSGKGVDTAYDAARAASQQNPVVVPKQDLEANLAPKLQEIEQKFLLNKGVGATSKAADVLNELTSKFKDEGAATPNSPNTFDNIAEPTTAPKPTAPPTVEDLEVWRRNATNIANNSSDKATSAAIKQMIGAYDEYSGKLMQRLPDGNGSIQAYKDAVAARAEHGAKFQNNDFVDNILHVGQKGYGKSLDDLTNDFYGSASVKGKQGMLTNYNAVMKAAGDQAPAVQAQVQKGLTQKMYDNAQDGRLAGTTDVAISPAKLKTEITNLFVNQRQLATAVWGDQAVTKANQLIDELGQISSKQPNVGNSSNTAYVALRQAKVDAALSTLSHIPVIKNLAAPLRIGMGLNRAAAKANAEVQSGVEASQMFSGQTPQRFQSGILNKAKGP